MIAVAAEEVATSVIYSIMCCGFEYLIRQGTDTENITVKVIRDYKFIS